MSRTTRIEPTADGSAWNLYVDGYPAVTYESYQVCRNIEEALKRPLTGCYYSEAAEVADVIRRKTEGPRMYAYQADLYCDDCGLRIRAEIQKSGGAACYDDSEDWPQGFPESQSEMDSPSHCAAGEDCPNAVETSDGRKYGALLAEALTEDGRRYVRDAIISDLAAGRFKSVAVEIWAEAFDLDTVSKLAED